MFLGACRVLCTWRGIKSGVFGSTQDAPSGLFNFSLSSTPLRFECAFVRLLHARVHEGVTPKKCICVTMILFCWQGVRDEKKKNPGVFPERMKRARQAQRVC